MNAGNLALKPQAEAPARGSRHKRPWTATEMAIIQAHYLPKGVAGCIDRLPGRSARSIYTKAIQIGLRRQKEHAATQESSDWIDAAIRRHYREPAMRGGTVALAKRLGVTRQWISTRAATLGVLPVTRPGTLWTQEEDALLEQYATKRADVIAKLFRGRGYQRTAGAIGERLSRLGVDRLDPDLFTATELARCMGVDNHVPLGWIKRYGLKAKRLGDARTEAWEIRRADLRAWLIGSAVWDHRRCQRAWLVDLLVGGV